MPKEEWGTKRVCPTTGRRFYDLNKNPVVSPYTGEVVPLETGKGSRTLVSDKSDQKASTETVLEDEEDIESEAEVDLGDDVLEDDDDDENVSLDDIADMPSDEDDS